MSGTWERLDTHKIATGLGLVAFGVVMYLAKTDYMSWADIWKVWPMWMTFGGIGKLVAHPSRRDTAGGFTMLGLSVVFFACNYGWWGLTWRNSWPLAIVAVGISMVIGSFTRKPPVVPAALGEKEDRS